MKRMKAHLAGQYSVSDMGLRSLRLTLTQGSIGDKQNLDKEVVTYGQGQLCKSCPVPVTGKTFSSKEKSPSGTPANPRGEIQRRCLQYFSPSDVSWNSNLDLYNTRMDTHNGMVTVTMDDLYLIFCFSYDRPTKANKIPRDKNIVLDSIKTNSVQVPSLEDQLLYS